MAWAKNGTPDTLGSSGDILTITDLTATTFNVFLLHGLDTGGVIGPRAQFNNDTGTNYARRYNNNGGTDGTEVSVDGVNWYSSTNTGTGFFIVYQINLAGEEKLNIISHIFSATAGAGTAPTRHEAVSKWANTSVQISEIDVNNVGAGSYDTSSNLSDLGTD